MRFKKNTEKSSAECLDCNKSWNNILNAKEKAYNHTFETGHETKGEETTSFNFPARNRRQHKWK